MQMNQICRKNEDKFIRQSKIAQERMVFRRQQIRVPLLSNKIWQQERPGVFQSVLLGMEESEEKMRTPTVHTETTPILGGLLLGSMNTKPTDILLQGATQAEKRKKVLNFLDSLLLITF